MPGSKTAGALSPGAGSFMLGQAAPASADEEVPLQYQLLSCNDPNKSLKSAPN